MFLEASWRRCHSSSGFSLSQFVLFLHVIPDRLMMMIRSDLCVLSDSLCKRNLTGLLQLMAKWMFGNTFPTDTLQQKNIITDLKQSLTGENTSVLIILATTIYIYIYIYIYTIIVFINNIIFWITFCFMFWFSFIFNFTNCVMCFWHCRFSAST